MAGIKSAAANTLQLIEPLSPADAAEDAPELHAGTVTKAQADWQEANRLIKSAIRNGEFCLYSQAIQDLAADVPPFRSIFIRHIEEESYMLPPGGFFELAEEYQLMSELDYSVVSGVLEWVSARRRERADWRHSLYCINLSRDTISTPYFPEFVKAQVAQWHVSAEALCFEFLEPDVTALAVDSAELVRNLRSYGYRTMLGAFRYDKVSIEIIKELHFDFLKIEGSLVYNLLRSEESVSKVRGIVRMAHAIGINTIADLVESPETVAKLRELGVDYAQGEAIASAVPLHDLN